MLKQNDRSNIKEILNDFSQSEKLLSGILGGYYQHSIKGSYDKLRLIRFIFDEILHFKIVDQPMEKINWEIPFVYKGKYNCSVSHQKFGFNIYVSPKGDEKSKEIANEIESLLLEALKKIEPLIKQYAMIALKNGDIILENRLFDLKRVYEYFRSEIVLRKKKTAKLPKSLSVSTPATYKDFRRAFKLNQEIGYLEQAGYVAFFSMLEHICALFLAFRDIPERKDVKEFSSRQWAEKFKTVFDLADPGFKEYYDYLVSVSRFKRNPSVHGLFDKLHTTFSFYLPQARHKIPVGLYEKEIALQWENEELSFEKIDAFLQLLATNDTTERIMAYLEMGLNVSFGSFEDIQSFSDEEFKEYLNFISRQADDMGNMDW